MKKAMLIAIVALLVLFAMSGIVDAIRFSVGHQGFVYAPPIMKVCKKYPIPRCVNGVLIPGRKNSDGCIGQATCILAAQRRV